MKRRFLTVILLLCFLLSLMLPAHGYDEQQVAADRLYTLRLFNGVGTKDDGTPDYALERSLSRQEAVTMLVRLLGAEEEAKNGSWYLPFTDVDNWAIPYVGYAYANGLTNGISDTAFGGSGVTNTGTQFRSEQMGTKHAVRLRLPPLGVSVLRCTRKRAQRKKSRA